MISTYTHANVVLGFQQNQLFGGTRCFLVLMYCMDCLLLMKFQKFKISIDRTLLHLRGFSMMMYPAARHHSFSLHMLVCLTLCLCLDLHACIKAVLDVVKAVDCVGGMLASWVVGSSLDHTVQVRAMPRDIVPCSLARHITYNTHIPVTVTVTPSTQCNTRLNAGGKPAMD